MIRKKLNLKKAVAGTIVLTVLSALVPDIAVSWPRYRSFQSPRSPISEFLLDTGIADSDPSSNGSFLGAIPTYRIIDDTSPIPVIPTSEADFLDLTAVQYSASIDDLLISEPQLANSFVGFSGIAGPIYEYTFTVPDFDFSNLPPGTVIPPLNPVDNTLRWYVPSQFTYTDGANSFSVNFGDGLAQLGNSLEGLETIFEEARGNGFNEIYFPSNIPLCDDGNCLRRELFFDPNPIPEPSSLTGLLVLGLAGGLIQLNKKRG